MSYRENFCANAVAEIFFKYLKMEIIQGNKLISTEQMRQQIIEDIEVWHKSKRRYSALNYATIEEVKKPINSKNVA